MDRSFLNRRNFIKLSAAGTAGGVLLSKINGAEARAEEATVQSGKREGVITRTLGRTGFNLPVVSLGVMRVDNPKLVMAALEGGMKFLDTAHGYQGGKNEEMLGNLLRDRPRDSFTIETKINPRGDKMTTDEFMGNVDISLKRLQMGHVDILLLHGASSRKYVLNENYLNALRKAKESGKTRFTGVSTHENMAEVINAVRESGFYDVVLTSYNFRMGKDEVMKKAIEDAAKAGIGLIAMKTMSGGFWDKGRTRKINTSAALKWVLQNHDIHTSIPGCTAFEEVENNLKIMRDITLTPKERNDLEDKEPSAGLFCRGCRQCLAQCPRVLPIPDIMRAYMYAYGYKDLALAREVIDQSGIDANPCKNCDSCKVRCSMGFDVTGKISDISRIKEIPVDFIV